MSGRRRRVIAALVTATLGLSTVAVAAPGDGVASAPAPSRDPDAWARMCSAARLGLGEDTVARAPVLAGDTAPDGRPVRNVAASDGSWYPIVMVHGWTSQDTVADPGDRRGAFSHLIDFVQRPGGHGTRVPFVAWTVAGPAGCGGVHLRLPPVFGALDQG
jgi:hypothetical protein